MNARQFIASEIQSAHFCPRPAFADRPQRRSGRKQDGIRYETKAQAYLESLNANYLASPWILFVVGGRPHWCQPDGIALDVCTGVITIIEIKYSHTAEAARQLRSVYLPVLSRMFAPGPWSYQLVEVVKWFDPSTFFPEPLMLCAKPFAHTGDKIGVHIWRP